MPRARIKDNFDDIDTAGLVGKLSDAFAALMRRDLGEAQLIALDHQNAFVYEDACATHDFCDANMVMLEALEGVILEEGKVTKRRANAFSRAFIKANTTEDVQDRCRKLWGEAWDLAKSTGFSRLRQAIPLADFKDIATSLMQEPERSRGYPAAPVNALTERDNGPEDLVAAFERDEAGPAMLIAMAEAIRAKDDDRLASLVDDLLGPEAPTP